MKKQIITVSILSALVGCVNTINVPTNLESQQSSNALKVIEAKPIQVVSDLGENKFTEITLEKIMSDPDWIGREPESWYWGDDSKTVFYKQKRKGNILRDFFSKPITESGNGTKVNLADMHKVDDRFAVKNNENTHEVYTFKGNVFLKTLSTGNVHQVTHTSAVETSPMFLTNGNIAYRVGNVFYSYNLQNNQIIELANLLMSVNENNAEPSSNYLSNEQSKLINYIKLQEKNTRLKKEQARNLRVNNKTITQTNFYFGENEKVVHASLSPAGDKLLVSVTSSKAITKKTDVMPDYISKTGNIDIKPVRHRVADNRQYSEKVYVVNITDGTKALLPFDNLPGFNDDVLAKVKTENYDRFGEVYKSKKSPRHIHVMNAYNPIKWNETGDKVAVLFEAWDNKDRWLTTVNFDDNKLVSQHKLHDDAWINWSFNEFGWLNSNSINGKLENALTDSLYYLSEESGYSHLYVKPLDGKAKKITSGAFEVSDLTLSNDEQSIFFKANKKHPGIYEIYQLTLNNCKVKALTDLGGKNDYELSPDNSKLLISHSTITMPPELYVELIDDKPEAVRLTHTVSQDFLAMPWSTPKIVPISSSNQQAPIYSKVYLPNGYEESASKNKAVMFTHGAGYLQNSHLGWSGYFREYMFHSLLVQKGYVVIDMDYRASAGYGRDWRTAIYRHMGKPEVEDMRDGVNWLVDNANVDRDRIGTYGGSYGGFLTLMSMFTQPDLFQSGSALRLVSDWAYYNHGYTSNILNTPADDPIAYERSSPIYFAEGLEKPLLINAPMIDDNVFFEDTVRLVQRLIELEKQNFETAIYPVEPHGFVQPSSWLNEYRRIFKLFEETL